MSDSYLATEFDAQVAASNCPPGEPEVYFHPERQWRFDRAIEEFKVAAEFQGATWSRGRHARGAGIKADNEKCREAQLLGWLVGRFDASEVKDGTAIAWWFDALKARGQLSNPPQGSEILRQSSLSSDITK